MARIKCMVCGRDLRSSNTPEDSHGVCLRCGAQMLGITVEQFRREVEKSRREMRVKYAKV